MKLTGASIKSDIDMIWAVDYLDFTTNIGFDFGNLREHSQNGRRARHIYFHGFHVLRWLDR
jgi:hypothetical protein